MYEYIYMFVYSQYIHTKAWKIWKSPGRHQELSNAFVECCEKKHQRLGEMVTFPNTGVQRPQECKGGRIWCFLSHTPNSCRIRCGYLQIQTLVFQCVPLERWPKHHWTNWWQGRGHVKWCDSGGSAPFWELDEIGHWEEAKIVPFKNVTWEKQNKLHHHKQHPIVLVQGSMPNVKCI
jgi:hypothetical protein